MEPLSALMLAIIALVLTLSVPRMYGDWQCFQSSRQACDPESLENLLGSQNQWAHRHFWCAAVAIAMVILIEETFLGAWAPRLSQVTSVYAGISLTLALMDSFFAQRVATQLACIRRRGDVRRSPSSRWER